MRNSMRLTRVLVVGCGCLQIVLSLALCLFAVSLQAATITVNTTADELNSDGDCSLREAIRAANTNTGVDACIAGSNTSTDEIIVPAGTYTLTVGPAGDDAALSGDLDIANNTAAEDLIITGVGADMTIIQACTVDQKTAACPAGQGIADRVFHILSGANVTISGVTVRNGKADNYGGGIGNVGTLTLTNTIVSDNRALLSGGGIANSGTLTLTNTIVSNNIALLSGEAGGGIANNGTLTITNSTISGNRANFGGGIFNSGTLTIANSGISGNTATSDGGGIDNEGTLIMTSSTVSGNIAVSDSGGIDNSGTLTMANSTVSGNIAVSFSGGIDNSGTLTMTNSTVSGNRAKFSGGGIYNASTVSLNNVTITNNTADSDNNGSGDGGGIFSASGTVNLKNTIIAGNFDSSRPDCFGTLTSQGHNLIGIVSSGCTITGDTTGNIIGEDPKLGPLADNGGPTLTHALLDGSPAIDGGNPAGCTDDLGVFLDTDQRGFVRPVDGDGDGSALCDIGAHEFGSAPPGGELKLVAIVPNKGGNTGSVTVSIHGGGFAAGATVKLVCGGADIIGDPVSVQPDGRRMTTTFDLRGKVPGLCDVVVTNLDSTSATLPEGFTIEEGGAPQVWVDILGRNTIRAGREETLNIVYGNRGNLDAEEEHFIVLSWPADTDLMVDGAIGAYGDPPAPPMIEATEKALSILVPQLPAQSSRSITVRFTSPSSGPEVAIRAGIISSASFATPPGPATSTTIPMMSLSQTVAESDETPPVGSTVFLGPDLRPDHFNLFGHQAIVGKDPKTGEIVVWDHFKATTPLTFEQWKQRWGADEPSGPKYLGWGTPPGFGTLGDEIARIAARLFSEEPPLPDALAGKNAHKDGKYSCAGLGEHIYEQAGLNPNPGPILDPALLLPAVNYRAWTGKTDFYKSAPDLSAHEKAMFWLELLTNATGGVLDLLHRLRLVKEKNLQVVIAQDPNDKVGSQGAGTPRYLSGEEPLRYAIFFENVETATASAQEVVITDQLDVTKMDPSTCSLGPVAFGDKQVVPLPGSCDFTTDVDLRPEMNLIVRITASLNSDTGLLTWRFTSIDPATGQPPVDPLVGFLPPNKNPPEGDGSVLFTVMPKAGVATGTEIRNKARIVFDTNPPVDTPEWLNTLDNNKPTSHVDSVSEPIPSSGLQVQWSGNDVGSGIKDYTIFVSEDGGPFVPWLVNTTATSASFIGTCGRSYRFYSVARDATGNMEDVPTTPDAVATITACDLAVTKITAAKTVKLDAAPVTKQVKVEIQNRSPHKEIIPDMATLGNLVSLTVESLGSCSAALPVLHSGTPQKKLPVTLKPKQKLNVVFDIMFNCANDPAKGKGHEDYSFTATVNHTALGSVDAHPEDNMCPRSVTPPGIVDPFLGTKILDKGCGAKKPDKTFGGPVLIDVVVKP